MVLLTGAVGIALVGGVPAKAAAQKLEEVVVTDTKLKPTNEDTAGDYDPWEPFNDQMFTFNHDILDRYIMKPVAKGYDAVVGDGEKQLIHNVFDNVMCLIWPWTRSITSCRLPGRSGGMSRTKSMSGR